MGLLEQVLGSLMGGQGNASPVQNILMSMLSGNNQQQNLQGAPNQGLAGNLGSLLASFQQAGLGHIAESWVGNGPNQSVSPQQLHSVLGDNQVQNMSNQAGIPPQDFLSQLSQHLPNVINGLTPHGRLPDEGSVSV